MKKTLSIVLALVMLFALVGQTVFAADVDFPAGYVGMSAAFRAANHPTNGDYFALDFRFHGDAALYGDTFVAAFKINTDKLTLSRDTGATTSSPATAVKPMPNGYMGEGLSVEAVPNNDMAEGWASNLQASSYNGGYRFDIGVTTDPDVADFFGINTVQNPTTMINEYQIVPEAQGLGLFSVYFKPKAPYTMADITESDIMFMDGGTDSIHGASFISMGGRVNDNIIFVNGFKKIVSSAGAGGSISPLGTKSYVQGTSADYTIQADLGKEIEFISVNGIRITIPEGLISYTYTFHNIFVDQTITASFKDENTTPPVKHVVRATSSAGGAISPEGDNIVDDNGSISFTITPNTDFSVDKVYVDGAEIAYGGGGYTFSSVTSDRTIYVSFKNDIITTPEEIINLFGNADSGANIYPNGKTEIVKGTKPSVEIYVKEGYALDTVTATGLGDITASLVDAGNGKYTYTFPSGLIADTTVAVTTTIAAPTITYPTDALKIASEDITVTGTCAAGATVTVLVKDSSNGTVATGTATVTGDTWTYDVTGLADGDYTVEAKQADAAAKESAYCTPVDFTIQTTVVAPTIVNPTDGEFIKDTTPTIVIDAGTDAEKVYVTIVDKDNNPVVTNVEATYNSTTQKWEYTTSTLPEGEYKVTAVKEDDLGNKSIPSTEVGFTIKTSAAAPVITSPLNNKKTNNKREPITGTCEVNTASIRVIVKNASDATVADQIVNVATTDTTWTYTPATDWAEGTYTVTATATDLATNVSVDSNQGSFITRYTAPEPVITNPATDGDEVNTTTPKIEGTGEPGTTIDITIYDKDGNPIETGTATVDENGEWEYTVVTPLEDGEDYTAGATETDEYGNTSTEETRDFTVTLTQYYSIKGKVIYNGYNATVKEATVSLYDSENNLVKQATVKTGQEFSLDNIAETTGTSNKYRLVIHKKNHTKITVTNVTLEGNIKFKDNFILLAGNMDQINDDQINALDRSLLFGAGYGKGNDLAYIAYRAYDLNDDDELNALDRSLLFGSYTKTGVNIPFESSLVE